MSHETYFPLPTLKFFFVFAGVKYHVEDKMFYVTQTKKKEVFFDMNIKVC